MYIVDIAVRLAPYVFALSISVASLIGSFRLRSLVKEELTKERSITATNKAILTEHSPYVTRWYMWQSSAHTSSWTVLMFAVIKSVESQEMKLVAVVALALVPFAIFLGYIPQLVRLRWFYPGSSNGSQAKEYRTDVLIWFFNPVVLGIGIWLEFSF